MTIGNLAVAVLVLLATFVLLTALAPWSRMTAWWVRVWDFPRGQLAILAVLVGAGLLAVGGATWIAVLAALVLAVAASHLVVILPYTPLWRTQMLPARGAAGGQTLRLLIANVLMDNREAERFLALVREVDPDVLLAVETDGWWVERLRPLAAGLPHAIEQPQDNTYGMTLLSRLPLVEPEVRRLLHDEVPSIRTGLRLPTRHVVTFYAVHPEPPGPTEAESSLGRDAELVMLGREIGEADGPAIVAGDLNDVGWSRTSRLFRRLSGLLDPRIGRGLFCTFHAASRLVRWPLDHVFVSSDFLLRDLRRLPAFGSDHFAIAITLDHAPHAEALHDEPDADAADRDEAREMVVKARIAVAEGKLQPSASAD